MDKSKPIILLDLGGVLVDLGKPAEAMHIDMGERAFWALWTSEPLVREFETGRLTATKFFRAFGPRVGIPDPKEFERRFRQWSLRPFDGIEAALRELSGRFVLALLSNTNEIHWNDVRTRSAAFSLLSEVFVSYETGLYKPDAASFGHVMAELERPASGILFFDDTRANVDAAQRLGIRGSCVRGVSELQNAVHRLASLSTPAD